MKALVTGASRGIGRAIAQALAARGAELVLVARDAAALAEVAQETRARGTLVADFEEAERSAGLVEAAVAELAGLDVLINCAGLARHAAIGAITHDDLLAQHRVNFLAPFLLAQRAAQHMREVGQGGSIINVASTLGLRPAPQTAAYAASKAALISMTHAFARELGPDRIRVNAIAPGVVDTEMVRTLRPGSTSVDAQLEGLAAKHLLGRLGTASDVANAALYLLDARYVTGSVLVVDGGLLLGG